MSDSKALAPLDMDTATRSPRSMTLVHIALCLLLAITTSSAVLNALTFAKIENDACDFSNTKDMTSSIHSCMTKLNIDSEQIKNYLQATEVSNHSQAPMLDAPNITHRADSPLGKSTNRVEAVVAIGQMAGATWNAISGNGVSINTNKWTGAVPASYYNNWATLSGFKSNYLKFASISCKNGFGMTVTSIDLAVSMDLNYQFIKNAKIIASAYTMWGQSVTAKVSVGSPVNVGTSSFAVAQIPLTVSIDSSNMLQQSTKHYTVTLTGGTTNSAGSFTWAQIHSSGRFC